MTFDSSSNTQSIDLIIQSARAGDKEALATLVKIIQKRVFGLCIKMLWDRSQAEDACQEILIKIITRLNSFEGKSKFETWVYRVATNHLLDRKRAQIEEMNLTFESFQDDLMENLAEASASELKSPQFLLEVEEVRVGCTLALLQCLDREHRLAYIIGEILELDHNEASQVLDTTTANFRKRLERARSQIENFTQKICGVIDDKNVCKCSSRVQCAKKKGRLHSDKLQFASNTPLSQQQIQNEIGKLSLAKRTVAHYRSLNELSPSKDFSNFIVNLIQTYS